MSHLFAWSSSGVFGFLDVSEIAACYIGEGKAIITLRSGAETTICGEQQIMKLLQAMDVSMSLMQTYAQKQEGAWLLEQ